MKDEINVCINSQFEGNVQICKVKVNLNQFEGSMQSLRLTCFVLKRAFVGTNKPWKLGILRQSTTRRENLLT